MRLFVSRNDWRRHDHKMKPQAGRQISPFRTAKRSNDFLRKNTRRSRVHVQTIRLNAETKKIRHRVDAVICLLTFPFIGLLPGVPESSLRQSGSPGSASLLPCLLLPGWWAPSPLLSGLAQALCFTNQTLFHSNVRKIAYVILLVKSPHVFIRMSGVWTPGHCEVLVEN